MRNRVVAAVLLAFVALCCALISALDLAVLAQDSRQNLREMSSMSVLKDMFTVIPLLQAAAHHSSLPIALPGLLCGVTAPFMVLAAVLVHRGRPLGTLLAALLGSCLIGFSFLGAAWLLMSAVEDEAYWYVWPTTALLGLAVVLYLLGLWAIPAHAGSDTADTFTRRALAASAIGIAALTAATYAWHLVAEHLLEDVYAEEPFLPVVVLAVAVAAGIAVLVKVATRRGGQTGVLIAGGAIVFPVMALVVIVSMTFTWFTLNFVLAISAVVPLLAGMVRLVGKPAGARADGAVPAVLISASIWAGPVITLLSVVGIDEARRIAYEQARLKGPEVAGEPVIGDQFLEVAAGGVRAYALLFAVAIVGLSVLARQVRRRGGTPGTQAAVITWGLLYLTLLVFAGSFTPFLMGDGDEPVHTAIVEGPTWYVLAVRTILACSALAFVTASALLLRRRRADQ